MSLAALMIVAAVQGAGEPLPGKTDIPSDFSTVICPDEAAAKTMLDHYHGVQPAPRNHTLDTGLFFEGLKATGCVQGGPDATTVITIGEVVARRTLALAGGDETYLVYRGANAKGTALVGIVDETGNNKHPRTDFERWLAEFAPEGRLDYDPAAMSVVYSCPTIDAARAAVRAIPAKGGDKAQNTAFTKARTANGCVQAAAGQYRVSARHESRDIQCGFECEDVWNALAATDARGRAVGLIFNGSHF
ncbi:hypothetical protein [Sphingopyxis sp. KK2]|uniref:hypothetical protein n=1 Tax=Sphingopyxis sp. KK2 TaxID=1855727 RepID=UPI001181A47D|nr:hypothetical protein [Sphingopyxis sp. KK2]